MAGVAEIMLTETLFSRISTEGARMTESEKQALLVGAARSVPGFLTLDTGLLPDAAAPRPRRPVLDRMDRRLIDACQLDFPIREEPFAEIAGRLHCEASEVLRRFIVLMRRGVVSRIGPVLAPGRVGASTLAAMTVPEARLEWVAEWVNRYRAVDRIREREHELNLWFVITARNAGEIYDVLADIRGRTGLDVLDLRLERVYDVDLEHPLRRQPPCGRHLAAEDPCPPGRGRQLDAPDLRLVGAVQDGLALTARPYGVVADQIGLSETQVMERLRRLRDEGVIAHMGVVLCRHELGYSANAMVALEVPRARVDFVGERLARVAPQTRIYRRTRRPPVWPYNLCCTFHGRDRAEVTGQVSALLPAEAGDLRRTVLFGRRRFQRHDALYAPIHPTPGRPFPVRIGRAGIRTTAGGDASPRFSPTHPS